MADPKVYEINHVSDFLNVPIERLPLCLEEFRSWVAIGLMAKMVGVGEVTGGYKWIDDDKGVGTLRMVGPDGEVLHSQDFPIAKVR